MILYFIVFLFISRLFSYKEIKEEPEIGNDNGTTHFSNSSMQLMQHVVDQTITINKFREKVKDGLYKEYMKSDIYLERWLRVTGFNSDKAEAMLRKALKWRQENNIDSIVGEVIIEQKQSPFNFIGQDYEGCTGVVIRTVLWDVRGHVLAGRRDAAVRWATQFLENIEISVLRNSGIIGNKKRNGSATEKAAYIVDMYGYTLKQHACVDCFNVYFEIIGILENYYPGYMKHFVFINSPRVFKPLLELLKPIMAQTTRDVLQVFESNKAEWERAISKIMPLEQFHSAYKTSD